MARGVKYRRPAGRQPPDEKMRELFRSNDVVRLSWAQARLRDEGIDSLVLDHHTSLVEGSLGAIPRRLVVADRDHRRACAVIAAAEEELG
jgi:putative signal transducing protein